jgi:hypothetical protein
VPAVASDFLRGESDARGTGGGWSGGGHGVVLRGRRLQFKSGSTNSKSTWLGDVS